MHKSLCSIPGGFEAQLSPTAKPKAGSLQKSPSAHTETPAQSSSCKTAGSTNRMKVRPGGRGGEGLLGREKGFLAWAVCEWYRQKEGGKVCKRGQGKT